MVSRKSGKRDDAQGSKPMSVAKTPWRAVQIAGWAALKQEDQAA